MRSFKDNQGRSWQIALNVYEMKRIRALLGIDLVNVITLDKDGAVKVDLVDRIANDPCLLVDILWVLVEAEAKEDGVSDVDFGCSLAGKSIEEATQAFLDELVDFFGLFGHKCGSDRGSGGSLFVRRCFAYADFSTESTWLQRPRQ